jgi:hypothetical protein
MKKISDFNLFFFLHLGAVVGMRTPWFMIEDDQVLFQYRDLNDRVYFILQYSGAPNSERIDAVLSDKRQEVAS